MTNNASGAVLGAAGLTPEAAQRISRAATVTVVLIAATSALLSWEGLTHLARSAGLGSPWALPVIVDGTVLAGMLGVLAATLSGTSPRYPWLLVLLGSGTSIAGNVAAAEPTTIARTTAVIAPVFLALSLEQGLRILRHRAGLPAPRTRRARTTSPVTAVAPVPDQSEGATARRPARQPSPAAASGAVRPGSRRAQVAHLLAEQPTLSAAEIARTLSMDPSDARKHVRAIRESEAQPRPVLTLATAGGA